MKIAQRVLLGLAVLLLAAVAAVALRGGYESAVGEDDHPCSRTIDGHYELYPFQYWQARRPFSPQGAVDGKVMDSDMA